jgi:hypothetical protein
MAETQHEVEEYVAHLEFPVTKEELINGLLATGAPGRMVALVERLPEDRYDSRLDLRNDLEEVSRVHAREVAPARTYDEFLRLVIRHVGDVQHTTKDAYNRVVEHVIHVAEQQGTLDSATAQQMRQRLEAAFADLRGTMSEVFDDRAPVDPRDDLPKVRD